MFSQNTIDNIGYYVYKLIDPRTNVPFYIGKGTGNRVFAHEQEAKVFNENEIYSDKVQKIKEIISAGFEVKKIIVKYGLSENEAYIIECSLIDSYLNDGVKLTNIQGGHHSNIDTVENIESLYSPENIDLSTLNTPIIRINVKNNWDKNLPYNINMNKVKGCWRMNKHRIDKAISKKSIILFEKNGVCVGTAILLGYSNSNNKRKILDYNITKDETFLNKNLFPSRNPEDSGIIQQPILYYNI